MDIIVSPSKLQGSVEVPSSKSEAIRYIICSALCEGTSTITIKSLCDDIINTLDVIKKLGAKITSNGNEYRIKGITKKDQTIELSIKESATLLNLIIPVICILGFRTVITLGDSLKTRVSEIYLEELNKHNASIKLVGNTIYTCDKMCGGTFNVSADESSQFVSGLLIALPLSDSESTIITGNSVVSSGYISMTEKAINEFGIKINKNTNYTIPGNQKYSSHDVIIAGDWSSAAFWLAAKINVNGLSPFTYQPDKVSESLFNKINNNETITETDECPDLFPILCSYALINKKNACIYSPERLRKKESDRINAVTKLIESFGSKVKLENNYIFIEYIDQLIGTEINAYNDHRIAMSAIITSCFYQQDVLIKNVECIDKSYPGFLNDFRTLGGKFKCLV